MREIATLNEKVAGRTKKEYKQDYKDKIREQDKDYYETRKETICQKHRQKYMKSRVLK